MNCDDVLRFQTYFLELKVYCKGRLSIGILLSCQRESLDNFPSISRRSVLVAQAISAQITTLRLRRVSIIAHYVRTLRDDIAIFDGRYRLFLFRGFSGGVTASNGQRNSKTGVERFVASYSNCLCCVETEPENVSSSCCAPRNDFVETPRVGCATGGSTAVVSWICCDIQGPRRRHHFPPPVVRRTERIGIQSATGAFATGIGANPACLAISSSLSLFGLLGGSSEPVPGIHLSSRFFAVRLARHGPPAT